MSCFLDHQSVSHVSGCITVYDYPGLPLVYEKIVLAKYLVTKTHEMLTFLLHVTKQLCHILEDNIKVFCWKKNKKHIGIKFFDHNKT